MECIKPKEANYLIILHDPHVLYCAVLTADGGLGRLDSGVFILFLKNIILV